MSYAEFKNRDLRNYYSWIMARDKDDPVVDIEELILDQLKLALCTQHYTDKGLLPGIEFAREVIWFLDALEPKFEHKHRRTFLKDFAKDVLTVLIHAQSEFERDGEKPEQLITLAKQLEERVTNCGISTYNGRIPIYVGRNRHLEFIAGTLPEDETLWLINCFSRASYLFNLIIEDQKGYKKLLRTVYRIKDDIEASYPVLSIGVLANVFSVFFSYRVRKLNIYHPEGVIKNLMKEIKNLFECQSDVTIEFLNKPIYNVIAVVQESGREADGVTTFKELTHEVRNLKCLEEGTDKVATNMVSKVPDDETKQFIHSMLSRQHPNLFVKYVPEIDDLISTEYTDNMEKYKDKLELLLNGEELEGEHLEGMLNELNVIRSDHTAALLFYNKWLKDRKI